MWWLILMHWRALLGTIALALLVAGCEGLSEPQGGGTYLGPGSSASQASAPPASRPGSARRGPYALVSPQTASLTVNPIREALIDKGYVVLPDHVAPRLRVNGAESEVAVVRCIDRGLRMGLLLSTRKVECSVFEAQSQQVIYTGAGEHATISEVLDYYGAVRGALKDLPAVGSVGRMATSEDVAAAFSPPPSGNRGGQRRPGELAGTGSGFIASIRGHVVTNAHVVEGCGSLQADHDGRQMPLRLIATDNRSDLAVLSLPEGRYNAAVLLSGDDIALGSDVVVLGFPLHGLIAESLNVTRGNVSSLAGLNNDLTAIQITAPVQPGNSGGPVLNESGTVIAVVTSKLNEAATICAGAGLPQNVNFAVRAGLVRLLLRSQGVPFDSATSGPALSTSELASRGADYTVRIRCLG